MKRLIASALFLLWSSLAGATSFGTDMSDLWWNPRDGGWGVNVVQQGDTLFLTFFMYDRNGMPTWFSASDVRYSGSSELSISFTGKLYQTTGGPYFAAQPGNGAPPPREVGTVTFRATTRTTAMLTFFVDGVLAQKDLSRLTMHNENIAGSYIGGIVGTFENCTDSANNGHREEAAEVTISQTATSATITTASPSRTCTYTGPYTQEGRLGTIYSGTYSCSNGTSGSFDAYEIQVSPWALSARATAFGNTCGKWTGRFGGIRRGD